MSIRLTVEVPLETIEAIQAATHHKEGAANGRDIGKAVVAAVETLPYQVQSKSRSDNEKAEFTVRIINTSATCRCIGVDISSLTKIKELKEKVQNREGIPSEKQYLKYEGKFLGDHPYVASSMSVLDSPLREFGIRHDDALLFLFVKEDGRLLKASDPGPPGNDME